MLALQYTGHPFFDIGLATIVAYVEKSHPLDLTEDDLYRVAEYIETYYTQQPLTSFLTVSLMNSDFTQPAFKDKAERRREYARLVAKNFGADAPQTEEICVFTGWPALGRSLSLKKDKEGKDELPPGRAYRQHIPLVTGEAIINFSSGGDPGLPVSGEALLCLQFFPMGCRKCSGRLLAIHSDNPKILLAAAREALRENKEAITLARAGGETKLPDASSSPQTLLVETLLAMELRRLDAHEEKQPYSITAYHLTNSGQTSPLDEKSPPLRIYHLPMNIVRFLRTKHHPDYTQVWQRLVERGWERPKPPKKAGEGEEENALAHKGRRNYLYEDIFRLPDTARAFVMTYLLRIPKRHVPQADPRSEYNLRQEVNLISWQFTALFLEEVIHMDKQRIEEIRQLGDTLASYVKEQDDKGFFHNFYKVRWPDDFRTLLIRANYKYVKAGHTPLIKLEPYLAVFEEGYEMMQPNWKFARDLVLIRMIERLYELNWFSDHPDALPDTADIDTTTLDSNATTL
ncbi:MAG: type I-B CRISPR-associated protein Cas8b1/Cst1 [Ktedonobacteraceae bacterium]|nr:type I-B CRISPR-associated protein Cas8b1/Cst1 [Ktedonobacteraceae bacterium]